MFSLSFRDVELISAERGVLVSYETVRRCEVAPFRGTVWRLCLVPVREQATRVLLTLGAGFSTEAVNDNVAG
jgi:hypothetical protein